MNFELHEKTSPISLKILKVVDFNLKNMESILKLLILEINNWIRYISLSGEYSTRMINK
jgi:hypothetical protein